MSSDLVSFAESVAAQATTYDLGRPMFVGMPQSPNHPAFRMTLERRHGDMMRADGSSASNELIVTGGHVGTHIDALSHVSYQGMLHGGLDAAATQTGGRFSQLGAETIAPIVRPGVLLDVPSVRGLDACEGGYEITPEDLEHCVEHQAIAIPDGAVILVRSGWGRYFDDRERYIGHQSGVPGPGEAAAAWLARHHPPAVGADTIAFERLPASGGHALLPAHRLLLVEQGIHIIEAMDLEGIAAAAVHEFLFICSPLKLVGATGSPVRPLAITSGG